MGWSIGYDNKWQRDIGYGVPAVCDHPECSEKIDRGLAYVCANQEPYGGDDGCGLFFCERHLFYHHSRGRCCEACADRRKKPFTAKPDTPEWITWKLTDESWQAWRNDNPAEVARMQVMIDSFAQGEQA